MGKWTRRAFITTGVLAGGTLVLGIAVRPGNRSKKVAGFVAKDGEALFDIWLKIARDNTITAIIPHAEMGQGVHTALAMMLAEELEADWSNMRFEEAPGRKEYANHLLAKGFLLGDKKLPDFLTGTVDGLLLTAARTINLQVTGGSASVRFTGVNGMRVAGAAARSVLMQAAAEKWSVPVEELIARNSHISHPPSERNAPYAEFAQEAAALKLPTHPRLKDPTDFQIMGTSPERFDIPAKVDGSAQFGLDVRLPGMKYATIQAAPVFGAKIKSVKDNGVSALAGVHKVIQLENAIAVIADGYWIAKQALLQLEVQYEEVPQNNTSSKDIYTQFEQALDAGKMAESFKKGKARKSLEAASNTFEAEYRLPYLAHAAMEPLNATAWVKDGTCEVWVGSQNPLGVLSTVSELLDIDDEKVRVHNQLLGGGFGRRSETDNITQAVQIARKVDFPVQLIWSREEDIRQDFYREAKISRFQAALDAEGMPLAWLNQYLLQYHPAEASRPPYQIDNLLIEYVEESPTHVPWGNWRSVAHSTHGFFIESFIDELAHQAGKDPYQYRRTLLAHDQRWVKVLDMAAEKAGWGEAMAENQGRGIAIHRSFGTIVAEVVEVEIQNGSPKIIKVICVADPGFAVHRDGFIAQMESGIVYGLTAALYGEISIENGAVVQSNFHDYQMLRMDEAPEIETYIINSGEAIGGGGEPATPVIAPALTNAIFAATGKRIRTLPLKNQNLG